MDVCVPNFQPCPVETLHWHKFLRGKRGGWWGERERERECVACELQQCNLHFEQCASFL